MITEVDLMTNKFTRMKNVFWMAIIALSLVGCSRSDFDSQFERMQFDGERRTYLIHVPESYSEAMATPLVIALHGGVGSAKNIEAQSRLPDFAEEKGFILVSPNGLNRTWNAGSCCGKAESNNVDDVGFIDALISEVIENYNIDENRIYVTGLSNGAMMSYRLACELNNRIAAIAPVAGSMVSNPCAFESAVSIIHFHSFEDTQVPYLGGIGNGISDHYNPPIDSVLNAWSTFLECGITAETTTGTDPYVWQSVNCKDSTELMLYITKDGGHSWPGGTKPRDAADEPSTTLDANELIWEFFMAHPKH